MSDEPKRGAWVYNWIKKCFEWIEGGKVYASPQQTPQGKPRPYRDPGKNINKSE